MAPSILVAYATRYGSTREVAEEVGKRLGEQGLNVDVKPAADVGPLDGYDAVVVGTALYIGSILKDSLTFIERHREALEARPVAVFALGPLSADYDMTEERKSLTAALAKVPWFSPVVAEVFVGKYDPARLRVADKLIAALPASPLHGLPASDNRDWASIDAWADDLPAALRLQTPVG